MKRVLSINVVLNNKQLCEIFLCAPQGGMRRSLRTNSLTLISDKTKLYDDQVVGNIYHYTGMGQSGDQKMSGQNLTLAESDHNEVEIHFFEVINSKEYTYRGQVELAGKPYQAQQKDQDGRQRLVWIFPLRLLNNQATFTKPPLVVFCQESGHGNTVFFIPKAYHAPLEWTARRSGSKAKHFSWLSNCYETICSDVRKTYFFS